MIILKRKLLNSPKIFDIIIEIYEESKEKYHLTMWTFYNNEKIVLNFNNCIFEMLDESIRANFEIREFIKNEFNINQNFYFNNYNNAKEFLNWIESIEVMNKLIGE